MYSLHPRNYRGSAVEFAVLHVDVTNCVNKYMHTNCMHAFNFFIKALFSLIIRMIIVPT